MKSGMSIRDLLIEVERQSAAKRDFVASTKESIRMVDAKDLDNGVAIVLLKEGADRLERFSVTENCHRQIAGRLQIPWKYYMRLLADHRDLVLNQVNALFEREPQTRLIRTLDGKARAFLSDKYRPLDNDTVLARALPPVVKGDIPSRLLSSHVNDNSMHLKVLFTDDALKIDMGEAPRAYRPLPGDRPGHTWGGREDMESGRDIVRPGCLISNSETGLGSLNVKGFFWRAYCDNGCIFGQNSIFEFSRRHLGSKLAGNGDFELFTDETKRKQDELIVAEITDSMRALTSPENVQKMAATLRAAKEGEKVQNAIGAVDALAKEVQLTEAEKLSALTNLLEDGDLSRWGMLNAVTKVANREDVSYERACELEQIGGSLLDLADAQWRKIATAVPVALAA